MTVNLDIAEPVEQLSPRITVIGVGGAGGNAVNNMIQSNLGGVEFLVMNTDAQALAGSVCERRLQLGRNITQGLGAGSRPDVGRAAAEEAMDEILTQLQGSNMVFVAAGMGGGTGSGGGPVIARAAREAGLLTVGVVTKPFHFEGVHRMRIAENAIAEMQEYVDTLIIIPNQNLFRVANEKTTFADAFKMADDVLHSGVRGVTDLMVMPGLINLDFADIRSVMTEMGKAMMGTGEAEGENRSIAAAESAISNPLLDEVSMKGARGVLINITGGADLTLFEVDEAANRIRDEVDPEANIIFGSTFEAELEGRMRVSVVATGIDVDESVMPRPNLSLVSDRAALARRQAAKASEEAEEISQATRPTASPGRPGANLTGGNLTGGGLAGGGFAARGATAAAVAMPAEEERDDISASAELEAEEEIDLEQKAAEGDRFIAPPPVAAETAADYAEEEIEAEEVDETEAYVEDEPVAESRPAASPAPQPQAPQVARSDMQPTAEPFAEAAFANATRETRPEPATAEAEQAPAEAATEIGRRGRSILARMTDAARRIQSGDAKLDDGPAAPAESRPQPAEEAARAEIEQRAEPRFSAPAQPRMQPQAQARVQSEAAPVQPQLTGLDAEDRAAGSSAEDDMLDIPAFLRRQAN